MKNRHLFGFKYKAEAEDEREKKITTKWKKNHSEQRVVHAEATPTTQLILNKTTQFSVLNNMSTFVITHTHTHSPK